MSDLTVITFDTETTGVNTNEDQIIDICIKELGREPATYRMKPTIPIPEGSSKVHGIYADDVKDSPEFCEAAEEIWNDHFKYADVIVGYNVDFDIRILQAEFKRAGYDYDILDGTIVIDLFGLWKQREGKKLTDAFRRFLGEELENAHSAEADVVATEKVLLAMQGLWGLEDMPWDNLALECKPKREPNWVGDTHHFLWDDKGKVVFGFGKHKGQRVAHNMGYLNWMAKGSFDQNVKDLVKEMVDRTFDRKPGQ